MPLNTEFILVLYFWRDRSFLIDFTAVIYVVSKNGDTRKSSLLTSKTKVVPIDFLFPG